MSVRLADVEAVRPLLADVVERTPLQHSRWLSSKAGYQVQLKCENLQRTGSFKIRGAYVRIARLSPEERALGVVAASAGNHAQGVALAASLLGARATIFMPDGAALPKVAATRGYGADIQFAGTGVTEALVHARAFAERTGAVLIHPFDHEDILAGQGTVGLEIIEQLPDVRTVLVPLGGGGLAAGISLLRERRPDVKVVGVQAESASAYPGSLAAGHPVAGVMGQTMADGIAVAEPGVVPFEVIRDQLDDVLTVSEDSMSTALIGLLERAKMLVEPSGAAGVAALLDDPSRFEGPVVPVLSGGNIDPLVLLDVIRHGLSAADRFMRLRVRFTDRPGELMRLLTDLASMQVNVLDVAHDREAEGLGVREVEVSVNVATRGPAHRAEVVERLPQLGHRVV
ncbi:threonine dehydratase [Aeromicrobium sp. Root495]|uniref:threonine ammonia-lyase n=1 Tax=Aeromicrobium sp. Root495 TaxID=1736550 RepID=UPI0006FCA3F7|nr:threonine ammonia-lyase [Aeromicrobium sp. Root495]KQY60166.1 threonine dehydratase [Aeromicrobium sp. Root495]